MATFVATAGYIGQVPRAPGTAGSAVGLMIYAAVRRADSVAIEALSLVVVLLAGLWAAGVVEARLGKDPGQVVIDEVLGILVTMAFLNVSLAGAIIGFFLFRVLDVAKPYPARRLEELQGGAGIMLDDAMAGVYANLSLRALAMVFPGLLS